MTELENFKQKYLRAEIPEGQAITELIGMLENTEKFIDSLLVKHRIYKTKSLENMKNLPQSSAYQYWASTFDNSILYIFELEDIKCRSGIWNDNEK